MTNGESGDVFHSLNASVLIIDPNSGQDRSVRYFFADMDDALDFCDEVMKNENLYTEIEYE